MSNLCYTLSIMKGRHNCDWLVIGSTEHCGRSCVYTHCKIHLARLREGPGTKPCKVCGVGVKNEFELCKSHGYHRVLGREWQRAKRTFDKETKRLRAIDISTEMEDVDRVARSLGHDIVRGDPVEFMSPLKYLYPMRRMIDEMSGRYDLSSIKKSSMPDTPYEDFKRIVAEMMIDGRQDWGRVSSVYTLASELSYRCRGSAEINAFGRLVGDIVSEKMGPWILDQGGWKPFVKFFSGYPVYTGM